VLHPVSRSLGILSLIAAFAATAVVVSMVYGNVDIDFVRPTILLGASVFLAMLTVGSVVATGSADRFARFSPTGVAGHQPSPAPSLAPVLAAIAMGLVGVGMALGRWYVLGGVLVALFAGAAWLAGAWAQHPDRSDAFAPRVSDRFNVPFGLPIAALVSIGVLVFSMSRMLLALAGTGAVVVLSVASALVLLGGIVAASRPRLDRKLVGVLVGLAVLSVVALGIVGLALGEPHHGEDEGHNESLGVVSAEALR
jgi:hypothetical protein